MTEDAVVAITIEGTRVRVPRGSTVAAALINASVPARRSVSGQPRTALCGMGVCHECRATIDGRPHERACMITVAEGMTVERDG